MAGHGPYDLTAPQARALRLLGKHDVYPRNLKQHGFRQTTAITSLVSESYAIFSNRDNDPRWMITPLGRERLVRYTHMSEVLALAKARKAQGAPAPALEADEAQPELPLAQPAPMPLLALPAPETAARAEPDYYTAATNMADALILALDEMQRHMDLLKQAVTTLKTFVTPVTNPG